MTDKEKQVNDLIMQEIGLEVGQASKIYDQDTGMALRINGADVVAPGCFRGRQTTEFNPYNNRKMMNQLFGYFLEKHSDETDVGVVTFYDVPGDAPNKGSVKCVLSDNTTIQSGNYMRDSLKYADIIVQLNGGEANTLQAYDSPLEKETIKKASNRGGAKNGRTSKKV